MISYHYVLLYYYCAKANYIQRRNSTPFFFTMPPWVIQFLHHFTPIKIIWFIGLSFKIFLKLVSIILNHINKRIQLNVTFCLKNIVTVPWHGTPTTRKGFVFVPCDWPRHSTLVHISVKCNWNLKYMKWILLIFICNC